MISALRAKRTLLAWTVPVTIVVAVSIALTIRQASSARAPERVRFSGSTVIAAMPSLLASPELPARVDVAIVRDAAAAEFYDSPASLDSIVRSWRDVLRAVGADARIVSSAALSTAPDAHVLVVPSSPCLTIATREAIARAGARGQGLIVTGTPGTHDAGCRRIGYGLLVALTGASRAQPLQDRTMVHVAVPRGSPLALDVPPGARIGVRPGAQVALRAATRDAYYSDYDLRPEPANNLPLLDAAISRGSYHGARVVYWGFELRDVVDLPWNRTVVALLVRNSTAWAAGLPLAAVEPWPNARQAAAVVAQDVEYQFGNARHAADSLQAIGIPGTYFVATGTAHYYRRLLRQLMHAGEVGSHTVDHRLLGGLSADEQREQLLTTQRDLETLTDQRGAGLRPPEEQFDRATMAAWLAAGGSYLLGANDWRSAAPELLSIDGDTLVLVPRTAADDIAVMGRAVPDAARIESRFLEDFTHLRALGGLYTLSYHSQLLAQPQHVPILARIARTIAADTTVWAATASEIARWWTTRAQLRTELRARGDSLLELNIWNPGAVPVRGIVVQVLLPRGTRVANADAVLLAADAGTARVLVRDLPPGMARKVALKLSR